MSNMSKSAESYIKEFNSQYQIYQRQKLEGIENLLNRNLSLLCGSQNLDVFSPDSVNVCQFYINLHSLCGSLDPKSDSLRLCISVLQEAARNLDARQAFIKDFRFIPVIAKILVKVSAPDKINRLLTFLQDLTYGIHITWEEPYLIDLIEHLVDFVYGEEESIGFLALSILINLCYGNPPSIYLLMRAVRTSSFASKIKNFGILGIKMLIILNSVDVPSANDLQNFIKKSFSEIEIALKNWNVPYLRHIVDFITNAKTHDGLYSTLIDYSNFGNDVENLLKHIEHRLEMDDVELGDENQKNLQICLALIFKLFDHIFHLKKPDNLSQVVLPVFNLAIKWVESKYAGAQAMCIVRTIVEYVDEENVSIIVDKTKEVIQNVIVKSENSEIPDENIAALFMLLLALLENSKMQCLVLSTITESYFDKIFTPLTSINPEMLNYTKLSADTLSKYLLCLLLLIQFSDIAKSAWIGKVLKLLKTVQIQFAIAKAILSGDESSCSIAFEISKTAEFPREDVATIVVQLLPLLKQTQYVKDNTEIIKKPRIAVENGRMCISKALEERLDKLIEHIFQSNKNSELENVPASELIEMFNYKLNLCANTEKNLVKRLEDASSEITNLSHRLILQSNEMSKIYSMNFKLHLTQERLQAQNSDLLKQLEYLKKITAELSERAEVEKNKLHEQTKVIKVRTAQIEELKKDLDKYMKKDEENVAELKHLQTLNKEYTGRIEQFKTNIVVFEGNLKEKQRLLDERDKEMSKANKNIQDLKESNLKSENVIKHLENQLAEKNEAIRSYEAELLETEELRKTILSLMESKKPKRKASANN